jgi:hypothetical protein
MLKNGKKKSNFFEKFLFCNSRAYEVWGSPEMLNKEKAKRSKTRQDEYEGTYK